MDEILALLDQAKSQYHSKYPDADRAAIFDSHLATLAMTVTQTADDVSKKEEAV